VRLALALVVLAGLVAPARAHQSSIKYVDVTVDGTRATVAITIAPGDVTEPLGLPVDAKPPLADVLVPAAATYVQRWVGVATASDACTPAPPAIRPDPDGRFAVVAWDVSCPQATAALALDFTGFFALDARHEAVVTLHAPGEHGAPRVVRAGGPAIVQLAADSPSFAGWVAFGMHHIYAGPDHISFVLALLIVVVIARGRTGDWERRRPLAALRATAIVITGFTVAHSVSLIAAALGVIELPSRLVESVIAASIVYTALEDVVKPDVRWRLALTVAFGLIHGLGFASMLAERLPEDDVLVPLVGFNLGVEVGQLTIVAVALPAFLGVARLVGAVRYRRLAIPIAALPLVVVGTKWLFERM